MIRFISLFMLFAWSTDLSEAIVGGTNANPNQFPYAAAILDLSSQQPVNCGAVILDRYTVLTHYTCVNASYLDAVKIFCGDLYLGNRSEENEYSLVKVIYNDDSNLAIAKVKRPIELLDEGAINLPQNDPPADTVMDITSWGSTNSDSRIDATQLQYLELLTMSDNECKYSWNNLKPYEFCTTHYKYEMGPCIDDIGSPLMFNGTLYGILSQTANKCIGEDPNIFVRITSQVQWIKENMDDSKF